MEGGRDRERKRKRKTEKEKEKERKREQYYYILRWRTAPYVHIGIPFDGMTVGRDGIKGI